MNKSLYNKTETPLRYKCARKLSDYRYQYPGQFRLQPAYFELTEDSDIVTPEFDSEIGGAIPFSVYYGRDRRYYFDPSINRRDVNRLGRELMPLLERVRAGLSVEWDGNNYVARLTPDAMQAEDDIKATIAGYEADYRYIDRY